MFVNDNLRSQSMSLNASLTQLVLLSAGTNKEGLGIMDWLLQEGITGHKMSFLDRRNSPVPGRIPAYAQWEERRRNQDMNTPQTRGLWPQSLLQTRFRHWVGSSTKNCIFPAGCSSFFVPGCSAEPELLGTFLTNLPFPGQWRGKVTNNSRGRRKN